MFDINKQFFYLRKTSPTHQLQGYRRNDRDIRITMNVTIDKDESFTDFFWIIQRKYIVYEGDEECPDEENGNCFVAKRRRKIRNSGRKNDYQMHLIIDKLSRDDLRYPVVLIKNYEDNKTKKDLFQMQFVPKFAPLKDYDNDDDYDDYEELPDDEYDDDDDSREVFEARDSLKDRTTFSRKVEPDGDNNCIIKRTKVKTGRSISYPYLCVKLVCLESRNVDVRSMNEIDCRQRKTRGQGFKRSLFQK